MPRDLPQGSLLLLDACCLINLFATGRIQEILQTLPYDFATSRLVATKEILSIAQTGETGREVMSPERLESLNLAILDLSSEEEIAGFVRFAIDLDDGEASICALAVTRGGAVATDDRKALRLLDGLTHRVSVVQTPELVHEWARLSRAPQGEIGQILRAVRQRARFYPRRDAPEFDWWDTFFR